MDKVPSMAAQVLLTVIPIVGIVMASVVVFFYLLWQHRRSVLLIQAGHYERPHFEILTFSLLTGLLLTFLGFTMTVFLGLVAGKGYSLLGGLIPLALGLGLLVFYGVKRGETGR